MDNNNIIFLKLYNELDGLLQDRYKDFNRSRSMIMRYSQDLLKSAYSKTYERGRIIDSIRQLRNLLVHDLDMNKDELIDISSKTIDFLKNEISILSNPQTAFDICTPFNDILYVKQGDNLKNSILKMLDRGNLQVPIIDNMKRVNGVFSPNALLHYLSQHPLGTQNNLSIETLNDYTKFENHVSEYYEFVGKKTSSEEVAELFDRYYKQNKKLVMVFVTETGNKTQSVLGIITPYDVLKLELE